MPHLVLEYTDNIPDFKPQQALAELYRTLKGSGQFEGPDIKSRAVALSCSRSATAARRPALSTSP